MSFSVRFLACKVSLFFVSAFLCLSLLAAAAVDARAQAGQPGMAANDNEYSMNEIVNSGHRFFGDTSGGLATAIQAIFKKYGQPNAYITGEEGSGAFFGGLTYGEGALYTKGAGNYKVFWQGPSIGWDFGGNGSRIMILVYNLSDINTMWGRYGGMSGSAYLVAGVGFNVLQRRDVLLVPVRTGLGARLGVNVGYLKLTAKPTWNPF